MEAMLILNDSLYFRQLSLFNFVQPSEEMALGFPHMRWMLWCAHGIFAHDDEKSKASGWKRRNMSSTMSCSTKGPPRTRGNDDF